MRHIKNINVMLLNRDKRNKAKWPQEAAYATKGDGQF